jgi:hypothetical protein
LELLGDVCYSFRRIEFNTIRFGSREGIARTN